MRLSTSLTNFSLFHQKTGVLFGRTECTGEQKREGRYNVIENNIIISSPVGRSGSSSSADYYRLIARQPQSQSASLLSSHPMCDCKAKKLQQLLCARRGEENNAAKRQTGGRQCACSMHQSPESTDQVRCELPCPLLCLLLSMFVTHLLTPSCTLCLLLHTHTLTLVR